MQEESNSDEHALKRAVLAGDEAAWRALYERSFDAVHAHVQSRAGRRDALAEDIVQETWMVAVRRLRAFDPSRGSFVGWLHGIADNLFRNAERRERRVTAVTLGEVEDRRVVPAQEEDLAVSVGDTLAKLSQGYQELLQAKYAEGLPVAEIARRSNQTPKAVESRLSRARAAFRKAFGRRDEHHRGSGEEL